LKKTGVELAVLETAVLETKAVTTREKAALKIWKSIPKPRETIGFKVIRRKRSIRLCIS
jgi:hypothetical protein